MKYHYNPAFNARVYGAAEARAEKYWKKRKNEPMSFYTDPRWTRKRAKILHRDKYLCQESKRFGKKVSATIVHHIFPREDYPEFEWCDWNLISLSMAEHNRMHDRDTNELTAKGLELLDRTKRKYRREIERITGGEIAMGTVRVVIGLPGSGKTTYALNHKAKQDIMLDLDLLYAALTGDDAHACKPDDIASFINDLIRAATRRAKEQGFNVWLIRCRLDDDSRSISDEVIDMKVPKAECIRRLKADGRFREDVMEKF